MITIYILESSDNNAEVIIHDSKKSFTPIVNKRLISNAVLASFYVEWSVFVAQTIQIKNAIKNLSSINVEIEENILKKGKTLSSILFSNYIIFSESSVKETLIFSVDAKYANLPFEIINLNNRFIADSFHVVRQIRSLSEKLNKELSKTRKKLFIYNSNNTDLNSSVQKEKNNLTVTQKDWSIIDCAHISSARLFEELHDCKYIHFAGHSDANGIPVSANHKILSEDISRLNLNNVEVVFFNSCYSSKQNTELDSLAQAFIKAGVQHYIGYSLPVRDDIALQISNIFWKEICNHCIYEVIELIRKTIKQKHGSGEISWAILQYAGSGNLHKKYSRSLLVKIAITMAVLFIVIVSIFIRDFNFSNNQTDKKNVLRAISNTQPSYNERVRITGNNSLNLNREQREKLLFKIKNNIQSIRLENIMIEFIDSPHPFYSQDQRIKLVNEIIDEPTDENIKMIKIKNEIVK